MKAEQLALKPEPVWTPKDREMAVALGYLRGQEELIATRKLIAAYERGHRR